MTNNVVKFTPETIATLKALHSINQSLKIVKDEDTIKTVNETKTCAVYAKIGQVLPRDFCVYDLSTFISVLGVIKDPVVDFSNEKYITIKSEDGSQKLRYTDCAENVVTSYFTKDFQLASEDVKLVVTAEQLKSVMSAASAMSLEYIGFKGDGEKVYFQAFNRNNGDDNDTNSFSIEVGETSETFDAFYKSSVLKVLDGESKFTISKRKISRIERGEKYVFWIALDANSSFE